MAPKFKNQLYFQNIPDPDVTRPVYVDVLTSELLTANTIEKHLDLLSKIEDEYVGRDSGDLTESYLNGSKSIVAPMLGVIGALLGLVVLAYFLIPKVASSHESKTYERPGKVTGDSKKRILFSR